jgi:hypothetical protein
MPGETKHVQVVGIVSAGNDHVKHNAASMFIRAILEQRLAEYSKGIAHPRAWNKVYSRCRSGVVNQSSGRAAA